MRSPGPPVPAHATHDELLVARLAGGDDLDPHERAVAAQLVSTCPDCGRLASDIAAISRAVAAERVPPRRRDFRITDEQAARLRGSPLQRLLRRFTLPSGPGALRPLATAALSIGLVLVFVGSVVPGPGPEAQPAAAPAAIEQADDEFTGAASPAVKASDGVDDSDARAGAPPTTEEELADTLGGAMDAAGTMEMTLEAAPGDEPQPSSAPADAARAAGEAAGPDAAAQPLERALGATASGITDEPAASDAPRTASQDAADEDPGADTLGGTGEDAATVAASAEDSSAEAAPTEDSGAQGAPTAGNASGPGFGSVLVAIGIALIAVGSLLAILLVVSRRRGGAIRP